MRYITLPLVVCKSCLIQHKNAVFINHSHSTYCFFAYLSTNRLLDMSDISYCNIKYLPAINIVVTVFLLCKADGHGIGKRADDSKHRCHQCLLGILVK